MVDEKQEIDDINLDDFNFDDLPGGEGEASAAVSAEQPAVTDDFNLDSLSVDDFNFDDILGETITETAADSLLSEATPETQETDSGERHEPFFEATEAVEGEAEALAVTENPAVKEAPEEITANEAEFVAENEAPEALTADEAGAVAENGTSDELITDGAESGFAADELPVEDEIPDDILAELSADDVAEENMSENAEAEETAEPAEETAVESISDAETLSREPLASSEVSNDELAAAHEEYFASEEASTVEEPLSGGWGDDYSAVSALEEPENATYLKWYSGSLSDKMFEISKGFESGNFDADEECKTVHVNVGYDTYGWEVQFSDGVVMNLRDVREYQIRNGRLPNPDGRIIYGQSSLLFSGIERIVIYESVKYFSYGI